MNPWMLQGMFDKKVLLWGGAVSYFIMICLFVNIYAAHAMHKPVPQLEVKKTVAAGAEEKKQLAAITVEQAKQLKELFEEIAEKDASGLVMIQKFIDSKMDLNMPDGNGDTPLSFAIDFGNTKAAEMLIKAGVDVNKPAYGGTTPLMLAARGGHLDLAKLLLAKGARVNEQDMHKNNALMFAIKEKNAELVAALLKAKANIFLKNNKKQNAFALAQELLQQQFKEDAEAVSEIGQIVELLDKRQQELDELGKQLVLAIAAREFEKAKALIEEGANVNIEARGPHGGLITPLYAAVLFAQPELVRLLLAAGADIEYRHGVMGFTPLYQAVIRGDLPIMKLLLDAGADPNVESDTGMLLSAAIFSGSKYDPEVLRLLLSYKPNVDMQDKSSGRTALMEAVHAQQNFDAIKQLLEAGADTTIKSLPLMWSGGMGVASFTAYEEAIHRSQFGDEDGKWLKIVELIKSYEDKQRAAKAKEQSAGSAGQAGSAGSTAGSACPMDTSEDA